MVTKQTSSDQTKIIYLRDISLALQNIKDNFQLHTNGSVRSSLMENNFWDVYKEKIITLLHKYADTLRPRVPSQ